MFGMSSHLHTCRLSSPRVLHTSIWKLSNAKCKTHKPWTQARLLRTLEYYWRPHTAKGASQPNTAHGRQGVGPRFRWMVPRWQAESAEYCFSVHMPQTQDNKAQLLIPQCSVIIGVFRADVVMTKNYEDINAKKMTFTNAATMHLQPSTLKN